MTNPADTTAASTTDAAAADTKPASTNTVTVTLEDPIQRGAQTIDTVTLRKPIVRDLRGINLADLVQMKTDAIAAVLPRISNPTLLPHEIDNISPADLISIAGEVVLFFAPKAAKQTLESPAA